MIGGEFEINLATQKPFVEDSPHTYYYASGRTALYQILKTIPDGKIWIPDYLCTTIIEAVKKAGKEYVFYVLNDHLELDLCSFDPAANDSIILINYFGLQNLVGVSKTLKDLYPDIIIIEDDVQAFFEFSERENPYADYRFTSVRKTLPVPDGGIVYTKHQMPIVTFQNSFTHYKLSAGMRKAERSRSDVNDEEYLRLFEKGEELISDNYESVMSLDSKRLYAGCDMAFVKARRKRNARYILNGLNQLGIKTLLPVSEDKTPLFIPVWLENRDEVRSRMFANEIYCPIHWPLENLKVGKGAEMAVHELSLIVDQRYERVDMELILNYIY